MKFNHRKGRMPSYDWTGAFLGLTTGLIFPGVYLFVPWLGSAIAWGTFVVIVVTTIVFNIIGLTWKTDGSSAWWMGGILFTILAWGMDFGYFHVFVGVSIFFVLWNILYITPIARISFPVMYRLAWE